MDYKQMATNTYNGYFSFKGELTRKEFFIKNILLLLAGGSTMIVSLASELELLFVITFFAFFWSIVALLAKRIRNTPQNFGLSMLLALLLWPIYFYFFFASPKKVSVEPTNETPNSSIV